ncbi:MAG: DUF975 family protein [Eubacteriales bacterium]|nr:DUF975 family protein [Eubacteriales bacterium]
MIYRPDLRQQYKAHARARIRENFWPTIGAALLALVPMFLISLIMEAGTYNLSDTPTLAELARLYRTLGIYLLAVLLIGSPIQFGAKQYYIARARGQQTSAWTVVSCFSSGKKFITSIKLQLCIIVRSLGWLVLLFVSIFAAAMLLILVPVLGVIAMIALIPLACLISVKIRRYDGAFICMTDTPDASVWQATGSCVPIFRDHNWELLVFDLSFILWQLLAVVTLGIGALYVVPYQEMTFVNYFDALCNRDTQPENNQITD